MPFNFPAPLPAKRFSEGLSYPLNLTADNRNYFTRINFIRYQPAYGADVVNTVGSALTGKFGDVIGGLAGGVAGLALGGPIGVFTGLAGARAGQVGAGPFGEILINQGTPVGSSINLPIPKKINEMNMMNWSEISLTGTILGAARSGATSLAAASAGGINTVSGQNAAFAAGNLFDTGIAAATIGSAFAGLQLNPFILQYFQRPSFREFSFTWTLAPRNRKESEQINNIINQIKAAQAPKREASGFLMGYPDLAIVQFFPADEFQIQLKECVIVGVNIDYTPAGPSYINGTSAPTMVNLTVHLKETKLWWSDEWGGSVGTTESNRAPTENTDAGNPGDTSGGVPFDFNNPDGPRGTDF